MCVLYRIIDLRHKPTIYVFFSISCAHIWAICGRLTFARYGSNVEHFQCHENSFKVRTYASSTQCKLLSRIYMLILCARIWVFFIVEPSNLLMQWFGLSLCVEGNFYSSDENRVEKGKKSQINGFCPQIQSEILGIIATTRNSIANCAFLGLS